MSNHPDPHSPHSLTELVDHGDRACAEQSASELIEIVHLLAPCVAIPEQMDLDRVARLATSDMAAATASWTEVTGRLLRRGVVRARGTDAPLVETAAR